MLSCCVTCCWRVLSDETQAVPHSPHVLNSMENYLRSGNLRIGNRQRYSSTAAVHNHRKSRKRTAYQHTAHLWRRAAFGTTPLQCHNQHSQQPTDVSHRFTCFMQYSGREGEYWATNPNFCAVKYCISETVRNRTRVYIQFSLEWPILLHPRILTSPHRTPCIVDNIITS